MWVSLNEIERVSLKAARGAGYGWSLAGEASAAVRRLAMRGLPFLQPLVVGVLGQMHRLESFDSAHRIGSSVGPSHGSRRLGPISVLTALSDEVLTLPKGSEELSLRAIAAPVLLLPVMSRLSRRYDRPLFVRWPGVAIECRNGGLDAGAASREGLNAALADWFMVSRLPAAVAIAELEANVRHQGCDVDETLWHELEGFANRTYVREGETSRLAGAGAGLSDRD